MDAQDYQVSEATIQTTLEKIQLIRKHRDGYRKLSPADYAAYRLRALKAVAEEWHGRMPGTQAYEIDAVEHEALWLYIADQEACG